MAPRGASKLLAHSSRTVAPQTWRRVRRRRLSHMRRTSDVLSRVWGEDGRRCARYCANCGTLLAEQSEQPPGLQTRRFNPAPAQPAKRGRLRRGVMRLGRLQRGLLQRGRLKGCLMFSGALFALVIGCAGVVALVEDGDAPTAVAARAAPPRALADEQAAAAPGAEAAGRAIPERQAVFIRTVEAFSARYAEAAHKLQRSAQRAKRRAALAQLLPDHRVQGWTGTLKSLDTDSRDNAYITIALDGA